MGGTANTAMTSVDGLESDNDLTFDEVMKSKESRPRPRRDPNSVLGYLDSIQRKANRDVAMAAQSGKLSRYLEIDQAMGANIKFANKNSASVGVQMPNRSMDSGTMQYCVAVKDLRRDRALNIVSGMTWLDNLHASRPSSTMTSARHAERRNRPMSAPATRRNRPMSAPATGRKKRPWL